MSTEVLTKEQRKFLEECALEFSDRFTDSDLEYKKIYDTGIPPPPIMHPWYSRNRMVQNRNRPGGSQYNDNRERYENNYRHRDNRDYGRRDRDHFNRDGDNFRRNYENTRDRDSYSSRSFRGQRDRPY